MKEVHWPRVSAIALGLVAVMMATTAYDAGRKRDWCIRFYPDGSEKVLYGDDCQK